MTDREPNPYAAPNVESTVSANLPRAAKSHRGVLILVLGIISLLVCVFAGIPAWLMANEDLAEMDAGLMDDSGRSLTRIGKVLAIISVVLAVLQLILFGRMSFVG